MMMLSTPRTERERTERTEREGQSLSRPALSLSLSCPRFPNKQKNDVINVNKRVNKKQYVLYILFPYRVTHSLIFSF